MAPSAGQSWRSPADHPDMPLNPLGRFAMLCATTAAIGGACATTASAGLLAPQTISAAGQSASYPTVSSNASGDAAVAWGAYTNGLEVSARPAGGSWDATPTQLSAPGDQVGSRQVVVDSSGATTAVWSEFALTLGMDGPTFGPVTIFTARRPAGGDWGAPEQLSTPNLSAGYTSVVTAGVDGQVVAIWSENGLLRSATRTRTGAWSASLPVSVAYAQNPVVAIDASGSATAVWQDGTMNDVMSATLPAGGTWGTPVDVSGAVGFEPAMAMNRDGDATVVWNSGSHTQLSSRRSAGAAAWDAPVRISDTSAVNSYEPAVVVDDSGRATAAWSQADVGAGNTVRYDQTVVSRAPDGTWGTPVVLGVGSSDPIALAADPSGDVAAAWRGLVGGSSFVAQTASDAPGEAWSATTDLTDLGNSDPNLALDGQGDVLYAAAPASRVVALADDAAGPRLSALSIPATTTIGATVSFAVAPLDVWSALGTTTWAFGDGDSATGAGATHQYATPGTRTVTVASTDALGQVTSQSGTITVSSAPDPPAPIDTAPPATVPAAAAPAAICSSRRVIRVHFTTARRARSISVEVTGQATRRLGPTAREVTVDLRGVTVHHVTVLVTIRTADGRFATEQRRYTTCAR
jgi:hypothetical protein